MFATVHGRLSVDTQQGRHRSALERYAAAWYEGGKDDPKLALLRLDPRAPRFGSTPRSRIAGIKMLLGTDPKTDYKDKVARVELR